MKVPKATNVIRNHHLLTSIVAISIQITPNDLASKKKDCQARKSLQISYVKRKTSENNFSSLKLTEVQYTTINNDHRSQLVLRLVSRGRIAYRIGFRKNQASVQGEPTL